MKPTNIKLKPFGNLSEMIILVAEIMPNGFDFTIYIRNSSKYLVLGIYNFGSKVFFMTRKIWSFWKNHYIITYMYYEIVKCVILRRYENKTKT